MAGKNKICRDYSTIFQITKADKDKYVLPGVMIEKQLNFLMRFFVRGIRDQDL